MAAKFGMDINMYREVMYSLDEIALIPAPITEIKSRKNVNPYVKDEFGNDKLPIFVSPMTCILNKNNIQSFECEVTPILPVTNEQIKDRIKLPDGSKWNGWVAVTLNEFNYYFCNSNASKDKKYHILIDVANGHMIDLYESVKKAKEIYGDNLVVMVGNIANPLTYYTCCAYGVDYVRVNVGSGNGCTTSVLTGVHASLAWLLQEIKKLRDRIITENATSEEKIKITKVVADGGVDTISKAIKCLALGADYVMMGKQFAQCDEACAETQNIPIRKRHYYGQSSEYGQIDRFGEVRSNPEGTDVWVPVDTTLSQYTAKFEAALRSAMSYCNAKTLQDFIGNVDFQYMSINEFKAYNK